MTPEEWAQSILEDIVMTNQLRALLTDRLESGLRAAIEAEREACAQICDRFIGLRNPKAPQYIADAIRARGEQRHPE